MKYDDVFMINNTFKFVKNLENEINFLLSSDSGELLNTFYESRFNVPKEVSTQYLKQRIASNYNMKYSKFNRHISLPYLLISLGHIGSPVDQPEAYWVNFSQGLVFTCLNLLRIICSNGP